MGNMCQLHDERREILHCMWDEDIPILKFTVVKLNYISRKHYLLLSVATDYKNQHSPVEMLQCNLFISFSASKKNGKKTLRRKFVQDLSPRLFGERVGTRSFILNARLFLLKVRSVCHTITVYRKLASKILKLKRKLPV